jgi:hypothetical protein
MTPAVVSKGEFARLCDVSPTRVGQWLREGKLGPEALEGEGRFARIRVDEARRQLRLTIDTAQRFGNGITTKLDDDLPLAPATRAGDPIADQIKLQKLEQIRYANRRAAEEELARQGLYVRADQTSAAMAKLGAGLLNVFEGAMGDLAQAVAAKFELPQRDVLHLLRTEFRAVRVKAAAATRKHAEHLPGLIDDQVLEASDPVQGEA